MKTTTVVIGAGHAGLAVSRCLAEQAIDHVVLERGQIANSWRTERWDSLRLITPNWQSRLPHYSYEGADPDGFRTVQETVEYIQRYAELSSSPVVEHAEVTSLRTQNGGYRVVSTAGEWQADSVVIASGACNVPVLPELATGIPTSIASLTAREYRRPGSLPEGGVLVVGASATGVQLAEEIHASGRTVILSVGEHIRAPRRYRGKDIQWWMDAAGVLDEPAGSVDDLDRARRVPSLQLIGSDAGRTLDLNSLTRAGIEIVGRAAGLRGATVQFSGSLRNLCLLSDLKMNRLLDRFDSWAAANGTDDIVGPPERFEPTRVDDSPRLELNFNSAEISSVVWATGFRPEYPWLHVPVLDGRGFIRHEGGVTAAPGMYVIGLPFLRRRKSTLIDGAAGDAVELTAHLSAYLGARRRLRAS
jgi:putative flavoprotein involved in K+ transport